MEKKLFELLESLVMKAIEKRINVSIEGYLIQRNIRNHVENSVIKLTKSLMPFFLTEKIDNEKRELLLLELRTEIEQVLAEPRDLFAAGYDGQKVFDYRYKNRKLPPSMSDEGMEDMFARLFPQIMNMILAFPPLVEEWKHLEYAESFQRFDELTQWLTNIANKLEVMTNAPVRAEDALLSRVKNSVLQRVEFQLDLTGLRGDLPEGVPLDKCFIVPELTKNSDKIALDQPKQSIGTSQEILNLLAKKFLRAVVVGSPGSGKSTLCRWIQREALSENRSRLVLLVKLREIIKREANPSFHEIVKSEAGTHLGDEVNSDSVRRWAERDEITFILDGFDEVPPDKRDIMLAWIKELSDAIGQSGIIVTSRPLTTNHLEQLRSWENLQIEPFNLPRIVEYVGKWYQHAPALSGKSRDVDPETLGNQWLNDATLAPLASNPLMLATILMVHHLDGELPRGRAKLYKRYTDGMLGLWDSRWQVPSAIKLTPDIKRAILLLIALRFHLDDVDEMSDKDMVKMFEKITDEVACKYHAEDVLNHLRERTGLLVGPGSWSFVHKHVGEYFFAVGIEEGTHMDHYDQRVDRWRLFEERHNDRWQFVLLFWAGLTSSGNLQAFVEEVMEKQTMNDNALAFKLLHDQMSLHRFEKKWLREKVLTLLNREFVCRDIPLLSYIAQPEGAKPVAWFPSDPKQDYLTLEGLDFHSLLADAISVAGLGTSDLERCDRSYQLLLVAVILRSIRGTPKEVIEAALSVFKQGEDDLRALECTITIWAVNGFVLEVNGWSMNEFVEALQSVSKIKKERLLFNFLGFYSLHDRLFATHIKNLLEAVDALSKYPYDEELLKSSHNFYNERNVKVDILGEFLRHISNEGTRKAEIDPNLLGRVQNFVTQLIEKRGVAIPKKKNGRPFQKRRK